ncbi:MAG: hypothetical protein LBL00_07630 [Endomicrobium sp.]|jgi:hypothetical protein|nr:hypothetical protein [Endomicrobium sp.]
MIKVLNVMLVFLCIIAGSSFLFYSPLQLHDLITGAEAVDGFFISWPFVRVFTEPIYAFSFYALTLNRDFYRPAIISWVGWTVFLVFIYCGIRRRSIERTLSRIFYALMILATLFMFVVFVPLPGPKLNKPDGFIAADFHSHTIYSHDNLSKPSSSLRFHRLNGYDSFFVTEHNHTKGFDNFPENAKYKEVFPGVQMQTKDGVSVLLLSGKAFDGEEYASKTIKEIIEKAHQNNMLVIMPHWWKWHKQSLQELAELGIDGFEIYNCGYRNISKRDFQDIVKISKDNNLLMIGSTDWHGWGYMTDVWTVFKSKRENSLKDAIDKKPETQVLVYRDSQSSSKIRFIFEPFAAFYYYVKNADMISVLSLMVWLMLLNVLFIGNTAKYIKKYTPPAVMVIMAVSAVFIYISYIPAQGLNKIIPSTILPVFAVCCALWFFVWRVNGKNIQ